MATKRSAKKADFKHAVRQLATVGVIEGTPSSLLRKLDFDGGWGELSEFFNGSVQKVEPGIYRITDEKHADLQINELSPYDNIDPAIYAQCAASFLLGSGDIADFERYTARYSDIQPVIGALAVEVDACIGSLYLPPETDRPITIYAVQDVGRSLLYEAESPNFSISGVQQV